MRYYLILTSGMKILQIHAKSGVLQIHSGVYFCSYSEFNFCGIRVTYACTVTCITGHKQNPLKLINAGLFARANKFYAI